MTGDKVLELVKRALRRLSPPQRQECWMRYAGLVESGDPNSSRSIDEIVYGSQD